MHGNSKRKGQGMRKHLGFAVGGLFLASSACGPAYPLIQPESAAQPRAISLAPEAVPDDGTPGAGSGPFPAVSPGPAPTVPPTPSPACRSLGSACGFNYSSEYPEASPFASNGKVCRITYYQPGSNSQLSVSKVYYTNCGTCSEAALVNGAAASMEGVIHESAGVRCQGSPLMDIQYQSQHSFKVETLGGCTEPYPRYFTYLLSQCG
jgi:hypothetical protein